MQDFIAPVRFASFVDGSASPAPQPVAALSIVAYLRNKETPVPDDALLLARLELLGHETVLREVEDGFDMEGFNLAISSPSILSSRDEALAEGIRDITIGHLCMEFPIWDDLDFVSSNPDAFESYTTGIVTAPGAALLGVPAGLTTLYSAPSAIQSTDPDSLAPGAVPIIEQSDAEGRHLAFAIEAGGELHNDATAPARRSGFSMRDGALANHTQAMWAIFDALVAWTGAAP